MLGLSAWKSGDLAKSEQAFEKALSIDPQHVKSLVNLSRVFIEQKRHDEAVDRLTRAAEIDPESTEVHRLLGRTYHAQGKTDEAVDAYRRAIELNERDAWSMNNLGLLLLETKRADEALPLLDQGRGVAEGRAGVPQQPGHGARAHRAVQGCGDGLQRRTDRRSRLRQGEAEPGARRSGQGRILKKHRSRAMRRATRDAGLGSWRGRHDQTCKHARARDCRATADLPHTEATT